MKNEDYRALRWTSSKPLDPTVCRQHAFSDGTTTVRIYYKADAPWYTVRFFSQRFDSLGNGDGWSVETDTLGAEGIAEFDVLTTSSTDYVLIWPEQQGLLQPNAFELCLTSDLEPPSQLAAQAVDSTTVRLQWQPGAAARTRVERKRQGEEEWQQIAELAPGTSTYEDTNLSHSVEYRYRINHEQDRPCGQPPYQGAPIPTRLSEYTAEVSVTLPPPLPPSIAVRIDGPSLVPPNTVCTWTAVVTGGVPPYQYVWRRNGLIVGHAQTYSANSGTPGLFTLEVDVTDANQAHGHSGFLVLVDELGSC